VGGPDLLPGRATLTVAVSGLVDLPNVVDHLLRSFTTTTGQGARWFRWHTTRTSLPTSPFQRRRILADIHRAPPGFDDLHVDVDPQSDIPVTVAAVVMPFQVQHLDSLGNPRATALAVMSKRVVSTDIVEVMRDCQGGLTGRGMADVLGRNEHLVLGRLFSREAPFASQFMGHDAKLSGAISWLDSSQLVRVPTRDEAVYFFRR
jgi:hypothetical protein